MGAIILNTLSNPRLIELLDNGAVGVLPSDTVYGIMCQAANTQAVNRLYMLKRREQKPGTIIAATTQQLIELGVKARYLKAVEQFWPNSISVELPLGDELAALHNGKYTAAFRIPKDPKIRNFLKTTGPLLTSSANPPGKSVAKTIDEAQAYFGNTVDFYVDNGDLSGRKPSTVIRIVDDAIEVLRPGAVRIDEVTGKIL